MQHVAIMGLGLMGGSLAMALKEKGGWRVTAYARSQAARDQACARGLCAAAYAEACRAVEGAGLVVLCVPVCRMSEVLHACRDGLAAGAVITDVGSTKHWVVRRMRAALAGKDAVFVGGHPLAGSEQTGLDAARADLYRDAWVALTPDGAPPEAVARVRALWTALGSRIVAMSPGEHDRMLARTSHLPHLAAALITAAVGRKDPVGVHDPAAFCGPGFRDTTRVASGSPDLWRQICETNACALSNELAVLDGLLGELRDLLERRDFDGIQRFLEEAALARKTLCRLMPHGARDGKRR